MLVWNSKTRKITKILWNAMYLWLRWKYKSWSKEKDGRSSMKRIEW